MKPRNLINELITSNPSDIHTYWEAAKYILFTDNEYKWAGGIIISPIKTQTEITDLKSSIKSYFQLNTTSDLKQIENDVINITEYFNNPAMYDLNISTLMDSISERSLIFNIPENVSKEYRDFCFDVVNTMISHQGINSMEYCEAIKSVHSRLLAIKTYTVEYTEEVNYAILDCNCSELHIKLQKIGYKALGWTTSPGRDDLRLVIYNDYEDDGTYGQFVFWNTGHKTDHYKSSSNIIICKSTDEFLDIAQRMRNGEKFTKKTIYTFTE